MNVDARRWFLSEASPSVRQCSSCPPGFFEGAWITVVTCEGSAHCRYVGMLPPALSVPRSSTLKVILAASSVASFSQLRATHLMLCTKCADSVTWHCEPTTVSQLQCAQELEAFRLLPAEIQPFPTAAGASPLQMTLDLSVWRDSECLLRFLSPSFAFASTQDHAVVRNGVHIKKGEEEDSKCLFKKRKRSTSPRSALIAIMNDAKYLPAGEQRPFMECLQGVAKKYSLHL